SPPIGQMDSRLRPSSLSLRSARCRQRQQKTKSSEPRPLHENARSRDSNAMTSSKFSRHLGIVRRPDNDLAGPWFPMEQRERRWLQICLEFHRCLPACWEASLSDSTQRASSSSESLLGFSD